MATLKAPYNFVPLPKQVYFPDWADQVSQDIPFADGESGVIELEITALSPIFIRDGEKMKDKDGNILKDNKGNEVKNPNFCQTKDGKYFIPATSLKGMIRSVLEILSYGKLDKHTFQNQSFGIRDLNNKAYRENVAVSKVHCGWLYKDGDDFYLDDHGIPWRIAVDKIDNKCHTHLLEFIKDRNKLQEDSNRTAKAKYSIFGKDRQLEYLFTIDTNATNIDRGGRKIAIFGGNTKGTIVFTGQPSVRCFNQRTQRMQGKIYEFVFPNNPQKVAIKISKKVKDAFITIHQNSPDYIDFRKKELDKNKAIPVFFVYDKNEVAAIGLSYMFKYPAEADIYSALPKEGKYLSNEMDMSDCIFGCIDKISSKKTKNKIDAKGRVMFSNAFALGTPCPMTQKDVVLATPHPSYYPLYLGDGQSWNLDVVEIAGRKRYMTRNRLSNSGDGNDAQKSPMRPLPEQTKFRAKIAFHNLKKEEIGALLSAITFHNTKGCRHNIGLGKSLGYGKIKIDITNLSENYINEHLSIFEKLMQSWEPTWKSSQTLTELFEMAKGIPQGRENEFTYMHMSTSPQDNEFKQAKDEYIQQGIQLGKYTEIVNRKVPKKTFKEVNINNGPQNRNFGNRHRH